MGQTRQFGVLQSWRLDVLLARGALAHTVLGPTSGGLRGLALASQLAVSGFPACIGAPIRYVGSGYGMIYVQTTCVGSREPGGQKHEAARAPRCGGECKTAPFGLNQLPAYEITVRRMWRGIH